MKMQKTRLVLIAAALAIGALMFYDTCGGKAAVQERSAAVFDADGTMKLPTCFRKLVFVGDPLTPNALNNGKASFPEYHHVYIQEENVNAYLKTGDFPERTVIVKELTRVLKPTFRDGSRTEPSGRGFSMVSTTGSTFR